MTRWTAGYAGIILAFLGMVWILQGVGLWGGDSRMAGDPLWALAGLVAVSLGVPSTYLHLIRFK